ncbi:hypothetical protein B0H12DRAFT_1087300 [Mycena haematopus]|nr:hypothetical protein B0H12DRAFT_1087300 [Mycena haematopus]
MKLNSPLPQPLPKECIKAAKIFQSFVGSNNNGLDGVIPREVLQNAKGFAIFTILKAGFLFSARAGTGIVIARLADGSWSAPSAIGTAGLGVGGQLGAEMTDFLIVLNSRSAVRSFMASGSLTLGGNMSLALGPLGRNGEAIGSLNTSGKLAAMYSYSKTRGLFGGLSVEGSVIVERQDANVQAYNGSQVTAKLLLGGAIDPPPWASSLIKTLDACTGFPGNRQWVPEDEPEQTYAFATPTTDVPPSQLKKKRKGDKPEFPPASWGESRDSGSYFSDQIANASLRGKPKFQNDWGEDSSTSQFGTRFDSDFVPQQQNSKAYGHTRSATSIVPPTVYDLFDPSPSHSPFADNRSGQMHNRSLSHSASLYSNAPSSPSLDLYGSQASTAKSNPSPTSERQSMAPPFIKPKPELARPLLPHEGVARAIALYDFKAAQPGDLPFSKGDIIVITKRSESTDDWWTGILDGRKGIFPANFIEVV